MDNSSHNNNNTQQIIIRNAFLAGALSSSLLWTLGSWTLRTKFWKQSKSPAERKSMNVCCSNDDNDNCDVHAERGCPLHPNDAQHANVTSATPAPAPTPTPPSTIYNPWSTEVPSPLHEQIQDQDEHEHEHDEVDSRQQLQLHTQLHQQLLELRTSLIEHSRRTSILLLDKILSHSHGVGLHVAVVTKTLNMNMNMNMNIGEMPIPKKRMRWPWESLRKHLTKDDGNSDDDDVSIGIGIGISTSSESINGGGIGGGGGGGNGSTSDDDGTKDHEPLQSGSTSGSTSGNEDVESNHSKEETKDICIGSIFGLDVGGTLSKLVYFEKKRDTGRRDRNELLRGIYSRRASTSATNINLRHASSDDANIPIPLCSNIITDDESDGGHTGSSSSFEHIELHQSFSQDDLESTHYPLHTSNSNSNSTPESPEKLMSKMKRSHSLFDLTSQRAKREEALDRFYQFANNLDVYDTEVKDKALSFYSRALGGEVHFIQFETRYLPQAMDLIRINDLHLNISKMGATGGGAFKFSVKWEQMLGITIAKQDELDSLVAGMQFIMSDVVGECYTFLKQVDESKSTSTSKVKASACDTGCAVKDETKQQGGTRTRTRSQKNSEEDMKSSDGPKKMPFTRRVKRDCVAKSDSYPYLLVVIGTGVSVIRVDGPRKHERISGSTIGGGTYWGLCRLLTDVEDFESVLDLAEKGDPSKVDM